MWISRKKFKELEKKVADLEQNQSQQQLKCKSISADLINVKGRVITSALAI